MGESYGAKGMDFSIWYCPQCDVAFVLLAPARSSITPSILQWHRRSGQLELREEDRRRWEELPRQFREAWESNVRFYVKRFLGGRFSEAAHCPYDGSSIAVVHKAEGAVAPWLFAWCFDCRMGFVYIRDDCYGWEHCADVSWNADLKKYLLGQHHATCGNHTVESEMLQELPPLPSREA
jgi:hypothetical protein